jgi:hypothetical protein
MRMLLRFRVLLVIMFAGNKVRKKMFAGNKSDCICNASVLAKFVVVFRTRR